MLNHNKKLTNILLATYISVLPISSCSNIGQSTRAENTPGTSSPSGNTTPPSGTTNSLPSLSPSDQEFMTKVAQSNMTVIKTSELAPKKSKNITIRKFAEQMIREHKGSSKELMKIAKVKGFKLPESIGSENQSLLMSLKTVPSNNFDRAYMKRQVQVHSKTQVEFQKYLEQGQDTDLKAFANKMSPVVAKHLDMARNIALQALIPPLIEYRALPGFLTKPEKVGVKNCENVFCKRILSGVIVPKRKFSTLSNSDGC